MSDTSGDRINVDYDLKEVDYSRIRFPGRNVRIEEAVQMGRSAARWETSVADSGILVCGTLYASVFRD